MPNSANRSKDQSNIEQPKKKDTKAAASNQKQDGANNKQKTSAKNSRGSGK